MRHLEGDLWFICKKLGSNLHIALPLDVAQASFCRQQEPCSSQSSPLSAQELLLIGFLQKTLTLNPCPLKVARACAGMYLGEITRRILVKFAEETGLFGGVMPLMQAENALTTPLTSRIDHDTSFMGGPTGDILYETLGLSHWQTFGHRHLVWTQSILFEYVAACSGVKLRKVVSFEPFNWAVVLVAAMLIDVLSNIPWPQAAPFITCPGGDAQCN